MKIFDLTVISLRGKCTELKDKESNLLCYAKIRTDNENEQ